MAIHSNPVCNLYSRPGSTVLQWSPGPYSQKMAHVGEQTCKCNGLQDTGKRSTTITKTKVYNQHHHLPQQFPENAM